MFSLLVSFKPCLVAALMGCLWISMPGVASAGMDDAGYATAQAVLTKYCAGCHNSDEANGDFALDTFDSLKAGGESGIALTPGSAASSRMVQLMRHKLEPAMPPEDQPAPTDDEIQLIADWIESGAVGPAGERGMELVLNVPTIDSQVSRTPITALVFSPDGQTIAVGQFGKIEIRSSDTLETVFSVADLPGKILALKYSSDGKTIFAATGVDGLYGEVIQLEVLTGEIINRLRGHRDMVYALDLNADETQMVSAGYDRRAVIWNLATGEQVIEINGHNGAIYSAAFDSTGKILTTASADATVKVWRVVDGERLDTRSEPLKDQSSVSISPDNQHFIAAGDDNRIRKWKLVSLNDAQNNPLEVSRFAHESAIQWLQYDPSGKWIVSAARDGMIKIWAAASVKEVYSFPIQKSFVQAIALSEKNIAMGRDNGSLEVLPWPEVDHDSDTNDRKMKSLVIEKINEDTVEELKSLAEVEPNDSLDTAFSATAPFQINGTIDADERTDVDVVKFHANAGETWIVETKAQQIKSPLDTHIAVFDLAGELIPRVKLQAVRDSYFTFRGKSSLQSDDFRIHNWEEMKIGQLLYCGGEVVRLYLYPRGPDSGFNVFPNFGNRQTLYDTTALTHALNEPLYVVEAYAPEVELVSSGLPTFVINYENDDDAQQKIGSDSRLTFTAPADDDYCIELRDSRNFQGTDFQYELTVRRPDPSFKISQIHDRDMTVFAGGYRKLEVEIDRVDGYDEPIQLSVTNLPPGFSCSPTTVEVGQYRAWLVIHAAADAADPTLIENDPENSANHALPSIVATAKSGDRQISESQSLGDIKLDKNPTLLIQLQGNISEKSEIPVIEIRPGTTTTTNILVDRIKHTDRISLGNENAGINFPFGVFVDNTGLNGVLIHPDETERTIFLTAESFVQPGERFVFLEAGEAGNPASNPAILRVLEK